MGTHLTSRRQPGQGGAADHEVRDLRAELLKAEAAHYAKTKGISTSTEAPSESIIPSKRQLQGGDAEDSREAEEDPDAKRRRILEETREIDADSDGAASDSSDDDRYGR